MKIVFAQPFHPTSTTGQVIEHTYFTLSYSEPHEQAEWVYYELTPQLINGSTARTDNFRPDTKVTSVSAQLVHYRGSGFDRGHLCPAGDMKYNRTAMSETFYMSNMSPQHPSFNRGIWKTLEATVRNWAQNEGRIYVVTGGILEPNLREIGPSGVDIPQQYYKVVYDPTGTQKMIALVLPNQKGTKALEQYVVTVDYLESRTGIDFFPQLADEDENRLESSMSISDWEFKEYNSSSSSSGSVAVQCKGIAKSTGVSCKNRTTNENGYFHYHQGQATGVQKQSTVTGAGQGRCQATTQAGTRCKRNAQVGSRYCWQHQK